jgi:hypothetical protein
MQATNPSGDGIGPREITEARLLARAAQFDDAEHRLKLLEARLEAREDQMLKRHTDTMTRILTVVSGLVGFIAVIVGFFAYFSKSEVSEEVKDMRQAVNYETDRAENRFDRMKIEFQQQFNAFAGESLKKPRIQIALGNTPFTNQLLALRRPPNPFALDPIYIKNVGDKPTDPLSLYLFSSLPLPFMTDQSSWKEEPSNDLGFAHRYRFSGRQPNGGVGLAPNESWYLVRESFDLLWMQNTFATIPPNSISCKLVVFYGGEQPEEAPFRLMPTFQ